MKESTKELIRKAIDNLCEAQANEDNGMKFFGIAADIRIIIDKLQNLKGYSNS